MSDLSEFTNVADDGRLRGQRDEAKRRAERAERAHDDLLKKCDLLVALDGVLAGPPQWLRAKSSKKNHRGIANLMLSDLHLDEVVTPQQMGNVNAYDRKIAVRRLRETIERTAEVAKDNIQGIQYDGITCWLGVTSSQATSMRN